MNPAIFTSILVLSTQLCGCTLPQAFSREGANYKVTWEGDRVRRIECESPKFPGGFVTVSISGPNSTKVQINDKRQSIWAVTVFKPNGIVSSCEGIVLYGGGRTVGKDYYSIKEWKLDGSGVIIYREAIVSDRDTGEFKRLEIFGPFGVVLSPPNTAVQPAGSENQGATQ